MFKKTKWFAKEAALRIKYMTSKDCIFCKIINGEIKTQSVLETDKVIAFSDINPISQTHILIVPKNHIESVLNVTSNDSCEIMAMFEAVKKIVKDKDICDFRLVFNAGKFQHVKHLHMHLLSGGNIEWKKL